MNTIDPKTTTTKPVLCPFCSYGCEFGVVFDDFGIKGVEYLKDGCSGGRLCPRGSAAGLYLDHPRRLCSPSRGGRAVEWTKITAELKKALASPETVAVTFDRNITLEEYQSIAGFCQGAGIKQFASSYLEPETCLSDFLRSDFSEKEMESAQTIVILGDPFNQAPVSSKSIINWRLGSRDRRLYVIDSIRTHTAAYAHEFLKVRVGTEPLLLLALAQRELSGVDIAKATGIPGARISELAESFRRAGKGLIIACLPFAHTYDPVLLTEGLRVLSDYSGKAVVPYVEFAGYKGKMSFAGILDAIKKKGIKYLINFGELFPFYYPQLLPALKNVDVFATSTLKYDGCTALPAALNIEKSGTIMTTFGPRKLTGSVKPASGAKTVSEMLSMCEAKSEKLKVAETQEPRVDIDSRIGRILDMSIKPKKDHFRLIGEKIAFYYLNLLDKEMLKMNPADGAMLTLRQGDMVAVESKRGSHGLRVTLTSDVDPGVVAVPAESPEVRGLFDYVIEEDNRAISFVPTEVKICREE
ncbi:hypothetical protein IBX73_00675 [candidate division WOR-3 bacterium]|nr:hypothetical protein [candidate division WOR-3 bacterium]